MACPAFFPPACSCGRFLISCWILAEDYFLLSLECRVCRHHLCMSSGRFNTFSQAHARRKLTSRNIFGDVWDFPDDYQSIIAIQKKTRTTVIIIMIFRMIAMMIHIYSCLVLDTSSNFAVIFVKYDDLLSSLILKVWKNIMFSMKYVH